MWNATEYNDDMNSWSLAKWISFKVGMQCESEKSALRRGKEMIKEKISWCAIGIPFSPEVDPYPYPPEAAWMTYDGLHPTDKGCEILANLFAERICEKIGHHMRSV